MKKGKFLRVSSLLSIVLFLFALIVDLGSLKKGDTSLMLAASASMSNDTECDYAYQYYECYDGWEDGVERCLHVSDPEYTDDCLDS